METTNAVQLRVEKDFPVSVARLYDAWLTEKDLKQWWHPMGNILNHSVTKPEPGAHIEYVFATDKGAPSFMITGEYKEVAPGARLVYSWNWQVADATVGNSDYILTVVFSEQPNGSRLVISQENFTDEEAVKPHRDGWEKALDELHQYLAKSSSY